MLKMIALMRRRADLSLADFIARYEDHHAPFARPHMPHAVHYVRRFLTPLGNPLTGDDPGGFDVLTEVWFADAAGMAADLGHIATANIAALFAADEEHLFDRAHHRTFVIAEECETAL